MERILGALTELHDRYKGLDEGQIADYIPELRKADPNWFAICIATADGQVYEIGDCQESFTIQSISKPFVYGMALQDHGREEVLNRVGVEPTGDVFNSIIKLDSTNRPHNPCANAGAIATTSLIKGDDPTMRLNRLLEMFSNYFGRRASTDMSVFMSERSTGHRNRAIAYLLLNFGVIPERVDQILDLYFQQCSVVGTCRDLAVMGATLANSGVNPLTGTRAVEEQYVRDIMTVMYTCGMYDYAGHWAYDVGLPAKSGVSGGILAVVPNQFGIAVYSPPLDHRGHSVRGINVCQGLSSEFGMHLFDAYLGTTAVPDASGEGQEGSEELDQTGGDLELGPTDWQVPSERSAGDREHPRLVVALEEIYDDLSTNTNGSVSDSNPELGRVDPELFGISVVTVTGEVYKVGDADRQLTLQSLANLFCYGMALDVHGRDFVAEHVGVEPTGNPFHAIVLERGTNRPMNPLVNAGAIAIASIIKSDRGPECLGHIQSALGRYMGHRPEIDEQVFQAERTTADRSRSTAYLMRSFGRLQGSLEDALDTYFQSCSIRANATDLATMAATMANGGLNPVSPEVACSRGTLRDMLSVMFTCGLYDRSGLWAYQVGVPANSSVSGGFMAVVPGVLGIGVFAPRLGEAGHSVRGQKTVEALMKHLRLPMFETRSDRVD